MTTGKSKGTDPRSLPSPTLGRFEVGESWVYEESWGLEVVVELPGYGTITQRVPWKNLKPKPVTKNKKAKK